MYPIRIVKIELFKFIILFSVFFACFSLFLWGGTTCCAFDLQYMLVVPLSIVRTQTTGKKY